MRERKSVRDMTDRELRAYKRDLRRRKERRRRIASFLATVCLITVCVLSCRSFISRAGENSGEISLKYYTGITVMAGDSLWSIADEYIDYEQYPSRESYIEEVCSINRLEDASGIRAGQRLIVPYYSTEFVK